MKISSSAFNHNENIPSKYTCNGENISPQLAFSEIPEGTKSLALIADDPDAPAGDWVHWLIWNIDPGTTEIAENKAPSGAIEGTTSFGKRRRRSIANRRLGPGSDEWGIRQLSCFAGLIYLSSDPSFPACSSSSAT